MPSIAESTIALNTPELDTREAQPIMVGAVGSSVAVRSTLPPNEVLDTVTAKSNATSGAAAMWKPNSNLVKAFPATISNAASLLPPQPPNVVAGSLVSSSSGQSFLFYLESGVAGYNVYRNAENTFYGAQRIQYIPQPLSNAGTLQVSDPLQQTASTQYYYWVTAVSATGLESQPSGVGNASGTGSSAVPGQVTNVNAVASPYKTTDGRILELVSVDFTPVPNDPYFSSANVYFIGYNENQAAQLMVNATASPVSFLCETTYETVTVVVVAQSASGTEANFFSAPTTTVTLNGVTQTPPFPSISQAQTALSGNRGWQFAFNIIGGLEFDQIQSYRVYHSESNVTPIAGSAYFKTIPQPNTNVGEEIVQEITGDILFYWVSAVNTSGLESELVSVPFVYIDPGAPPANVNPVPITKKYLPTVSLNGWGANAHVGNYESGGGLGTQSWTTNGASTLAYTNPGSAYDGNQSTASTASYAHTHQYAGCIWSFSNFAALPAGASVQSASVSILSDVKATSGPVKGHSDIWYSLDGGNTWTSLYVSFSARTKQTDTITLSAEQDFTKVQIMAFTDSHDDIQHDVFEISLSVNMTANAGPQQVTGVTASLVSNDVTITWNGLVPLTRADITGYLVYRAMHGAGYVNSHLQTTVTPTGAATYSWSDPEGHDGTWDYWVVAENSTGYSPASDVANLAGASSLIYASGNTVESLKPAQAGADVTASNTSADTANVNGIASHLISPISGLMPAQAGADVTSSNTSKDTSAVNGQSASLVSQGATGVAKNLIPDSDLKFGFAYWDQSTNWIVSPGASPNGGNALLFDASSPQNWPQASAKSAIPVLPGRTYILSCYVVNNLNANRVIFGLDYSGGPFVISNGAPGTSGRIFGAFTVPAGVTSVTPWYAVDWQVTGTASISEMMFQLAAPGQTQPTAYVSGQYDNTATWYIPAGTSQIDLGSGIHLGKVASNLVYANGSTVEQLRPAQAGADVTAQNGNVLLQNPNFAAGNVGWAAQTGWGVNTYAATGENVGVPGSAYLGWFSGTATAALTNDQIIPCTAGNVIAANAYMKAYTPSCTGALHLEIVFYNSAGTYIGNPQSPQCAVADWAQYRVTATAPANTAYAQIRFAIYSPTNTNAWAVCGVSASLLANSLDEVPNGSSNFSVAAIDANRRALIDLAQAGHLNKTASNLVYANGYTIEALRPAQAGSFGDGTQICSNPEFANGSTSYGNYQQGSVSLVQDSTTPNNTGYKLQVTGSALSNYWPHGLGYNYGPMGQNTSGAFAADRYIAGHTYIVRVRALVPTEFLMDISYDGTWTYTPLTSVSGTGGWFDYVWQVQAPASGQTQGDFGFVVAYPQNGQTTGTMYIALNSITDITAPVGMSVASVDANRRPIIDFSQSAHINKNLDNIGDGSSRYAAGEAGANVTKNHILTVQISGTTSSTVSTSSSSPSAIPGLAWSAQASGASDVYNIQGEVFFGASAQPGGVVTVYVCVDGNTSVNYGFGSYLANPSQGAGGAPCTFFASITGLSAGSHTIQVYASVQGSNVNSGEYFAMCQRIF